MSAGAAGHPLPGLLPAGRRATQYGYVVRDLEEGMARWRELVPLGPFFVLEKVPVVGGLYRGQPFELTMSAALAQCGDVQIELLVQHTPHPSALTDTEAGNACQLNHFGVLTETYDEDLAFLVARGHEVAMQGTVFGDMPFAYVDTRQVLSHMFELIPAHPEVVRIFAEVAASATDWNGQDPVRYF